VKDAIRLAAIRHRFGEPPAYTELALRLLTVVNFSNVDAPKPPLRDALGALVGGADLIDRTRQDFVGAAVAISEPPRVLGKATIGGLAVRNK
jgi:hypothetical protein